MATARTLQFRKTRLEWVARRLALGGGISRREAVAAIERGAVQVDGRVLTRDVQVCDEAVICFEGRPIPGAATLPALFGMIKPPFVACKYTVDAPGPTLKTVLAQLSLDSEHQQTSRCRIASPEYPRQGRSGRLRQDKTNGWKTKVSKGEENEMQDVRRNDVRVDREDSSSARNSNNKITPLHAPSHLIPVNSLPFHAEGLVLLTNDGSFAHALRDPANKIITAYDFRVSGPLPTEDFWRRWALGVHRGGIDYGRVWVQLLRPCPSGAWLRLKFVEPPGTDFHSLFGSCGLKIRRMRLYSFGPYLSSSVPSGCLFPLRIDHALLPLAPRQRRRLMLVPAEGEIQGTLQATEHFNSLRGGGFAAARLLKENSVLVKSGGAKP